MLTRKQKEEIVKGLSEKFAREKIAIFSRIHKIPVADLSALRRELKRAGAELSISKKTLMKRALDAAGLNVDPKKLEGEVGIVFGYENQVAPAKIIHKFRKANSTFEILAGLLEKQTLSKEQVLAMASIPSREELLTMLASALAGPLRNILNVLQGNQRNLVVVLNKIKDKK